MRANESRLSGGVKQAERRRHAQKKSLEALRFLLSLKREILLFKKDLRLEKVFENLIPRDQDLLCETLIAVFQREEVQAVLNV